MKSFLDLVKQRRSIRKYSDKPITEDEVVALMQPVLMAPTSKNSRPCEFILVNEKILLHQLSECKPFGAAMLEEASLAVVVVGDPEKSDVWVEDASVASTMLLMQAEDMGLGACWVQIRNRYQDDGRPADFFVHEILNIPDHLKTLSIIAIGNKGKQYKPHDPENLEWEKMHFNHYEEK